MRYTSFALGRITIEAVSPLTVGTGGGTTLWDSACVTDASALPAIPGSGIAGALRNWYRAVHDVRATNAIFGYQQEDEGQSSSVQVSWAVVHGENDRPIASRLSRDDASRTSELMTLLSTGLSRDHVRIGGHGGPDGVGKYDELVVPAGARFTFELRVEGVADLAILRELVSFLGSPGFRLGGKSRRGYGAVKVVRWSARAFDLTKPEDRVFWAKLPRDLSQELPEAVLEFQKVPSSREVSGVASGTLVLKPLDYWIFGGDTAVRPAHTREDKAEPVAMLPKTERMIVWKKGGAGDTGSVVRDDEAPNLIPATSVKGALWHRTLYHWLRAESQWLEDAPPTEEDARLHLAVLFGIAKSASSSEGRSDDVVLDFDDGSVPGVVFISDALVCTRTKKSDDTNRPLDATLDHVSLDRFTQGPMDGMLFREAPLYGGCFEIPVAVKTAEGDEANETLQKVRRALAAAVRDLCEGRLALGGGGNRGHGYFTGDVAGSLKQWLEKE